MAVFPTKNLSMRYVCLALGYLKARLSTLCTSGRINMWAKYKPVANNFTDNRPANWWKGTKRDCGLSVTYYHASADLQTVINAITSGISSFKYSPPKGGITEPFRLGDFAGYNPAATHNIAQISIPDRISWGENYMARCTMAIQWIHDDTMLSLSDLYVNEGVFNLADWFIGAIVTLPRDGALRIVTSKTTVADGENVDVLEFLVGGTGSMKLYPVLCSVSSDGSLTTGIGGYMIPLPNLEIYEVIVVERFKAEISFSDSTTLTKYTSSYLIYPVISYKNPITIPSAITGYIYIVPATANQQPLGAWYQVREPASFTVSITNTTGNAVLSGFTISKADIPDVDDPNCAGLMIRFTPYSSNDSASIYKMLKF